MEIHPLHQRAFAHPLSGNDWRVYLQAMWFLDHDEFLPMFDCTVAYLAFVEPRGEKRQATRGECAIVRRSVRRLVRFKLIELGPREGKRFTYRLPSESAQKAAA